ncbi:transmembrane and ubiquitin-like domain-containing protein 1 [Poeciliopsis prolifica]|uniref:transmembrane and ubiquitin-like domain-containing protein 1 n=1 Tax=Poeciliopsis prolifica TaxID=188132 RepID=UPI002413EC3C|nr:transmembrane and ubiquitin-like domain-containing protein 1 [Poeciliopsis prolifica]XP_054882240.1 transmembrane and ubiquitin-like domain-containing protein 1 [Poeciliopsis prolifica]
MAVIEGVGDEVTLLFGSLLLLMVLLLAWVSTRTREPLEQLFPGHALSPQDTPLSSTASVGDGAPSEAPPTGPSLQEEAEREAGDGARRRGAERSMVLRLKFLNDTERTAQVQPHDTIGYIKRTYFAGQEQQVRLIYQGQLLQDDAQTLASLNLAHNCVLHCHISQSAPPGAAGVPRPADQVQVALNVGSLMVPLLVLMLSVLWYCQIQYRQFFTAPATASLVGITIFLSLVAFGVYRR